MKEQLISLETAILAKKKGFEWKTLYFYNGSVVCSPEGVFNPLDYNSKKEDNYHSAPTQALLEKWLREKYNIHLSIRYNPQIEMYMVYYEAEPTSFILYEDALEGGLFKALKNL